MLFKTLHCSTKHAIQDRNEFNTTPHHTHISSHYSHKNNLKQAVDPVSKRYKQNNCNKAINDNETLLF